VQDEYSLFARDPEATLLDACRAHGLAFMAFAPLGRGMLGGVLRSADEVGEDDERRTDQRFMPGNIEHNAEIVRRLGEIAAEKGVPVSALALAWLMHRGGPVIPIPSAKTRTHLEENAKAADLRLTEEDLVRIQAICPPGAVAGLSNHAHPS
jgi:aryl-alcohol dehydrogenase-like predicted oxidoreductase